MRQSIACYIVHVLCQQCIYMPCIALLYNPRLFYSRCSVVMRYFPNFRDVYTHFIAWCVGKNGTKNKNKNPTGQFLFFFAFDFQWGREEIAGNFFELGKNKYLRSVNRIYFTLPLLHPLIVNLIKSCSLDDQMRLNYY